MERYVDEALVLSTVDYGESDRLVTLLTREHGKLTAFAAGARKSKRLFAGALGVRRAVRQMAEQGLPLPKGYGPFGYHNPEDTRLVVPKLAGIGWTLNFAHRAAWLLLALMLLPVLVVLAVVFATRG